MSDIAHATDDLSIPSFLDRTGDKPSEELPGWRDHLKVHPAANLFPLMSEPELRELGEDIKANGLRAPIVLYKGKLLDGRNRLDAMQLVGIKVTLSYQDISDDDYLLFFGSAAQRIGHTAKLRCNTYGKGDPYDYVLSANLHRRHLTSEQKRDLIAKVIKAKPEASNRTVAKQVKAHHTTVGTVRAEMESTGEISQLDKTTGADGKKRKKPAKKAETDQERRDREVMLAIAKERREVMRALSEDEQRATGSAEVSIDQRRAQNAALDEIDRCVSSLSNAILRHLDGLSREDVKQFFAALRNRLDEAEREVLQAAINAGARNELAIQ